MVVLISDIFFSFFSYKFFPQILGGRQMPACPSPPSGANGYVLEKIGKEAVVA
jgi:hypothetical protein